MNYHVDFYVSIAVTVPQSYPDKHALVFCHFIKTVPKAVNDIWCILYSCDRASWQILIIKPTRCTNFSNLFSDWNSICFGHFLCPSSGVFHCTHSNSICHTGLLTACELDQDGTEFHPDKFIIIKPTRRTNISTLFLEWNSTCFRQFLHPSSGVFHCTHSNSICQDGTRFHPDPARKLYANLYDIYHCCVYSEKLLMMDRGTVRNM